MSKIRDFAQMPTERERDRFAHREMTVLVIAVIISFGVLLVSTVVTEQQAVYAQEMHILK